MRPRRLLPLPPNRFVLSVIALAMIMLLGLGSTANAQVVPRLVDGTIFANLNANDNPGPTAAGSRTCPCTGILFPGLLGVKPLVPTQTWGAVVMAGSAVGDPISLTRTGIFSRMTSASIMSLPPNIVQITTMYNGRLNSGVLASGAGPGNFTSNPLASGQASFMHTTGINQSGSVVTFPALSPRPTATFRQKVTAGPRQFGGSINLLRVGTGNKIILSVATPPGNLVQTGTYGGAIAGAASTNVTLRKFVHTAVPSFMLTNFSKFWGNPWTTGVASVRSKATLSHSFARSGIDEITSMGQRHIQLVTPTLAGGKSITGGLSGIPFIWQWEMQFAPEPGSLTSLGAGLVVMSILFARRKRTAQAA